MGDITELTVHVEDSRSATQKLTDATRGGADDAQSSGKTYLQSAQEMAGNAAQTVSDTLASMWCFPPVPNTCMTS